MSDVQEAIDGVLACVVAIQCVLIENGLCTKDELDALQLRAVGEIEQGRAGQREEAMRQYAEELLHQAQTCDVDVIVIFLFPSQALADERMNNEVLQGRKRIAHFIP